MREELMAVNSLRRSNAARKMLPRDDKFRKLPNSNSIDPGVMASYYNQQIDANSTAASFQVDPPDQDYMQLGSYWIEGLSGSTFCLPDPDPVQSARPAEKVKIFFGRKGKQTEEMEGFEQETREASSVVAQPAPAEYYQDQQVEDLEDIQEELPRERIEEKMHNCAMKHREQEEHHELKTVAEQEDEHEEMDTNLLTRYPPPSVLGELPPRDKGVYSKTPGSFPETDEDESESAMQVIARQIVQSSVDNVLDQVKAENVRLEQLHELRRPEAASQQDKGKGKARADDGNVSTTTIPAIRISSEDAPDGGPEASSSAASTGRSRFRLGRLFNKRGATQGSTSSEASSSRDTLSPVSTTTSEEAAAQEKLKTLHFPLLRFINKHRSATSDGGKETMECVACFTDLPARKVVATPCKHLYCRDCFTQLITTSLDSNSEAQWPPKCCLTPIPIGTIVKYATSSRALFERYKAKEAEYQIPADQRIYCSTPNCGEWIPPTRRAIDKAAKTARCSKGHTMCVMCLGPPHKCSEVCAEDRDLQLLDEIAEESGWKKCFKCQTLVEHSAACAHMTCRCGAQFCYICGLRWKTCACDSSELSRIKLRAEQNRLQREARDRGESSSAPAAATVADAEEAEWLANQLQLIEAMEMETEAGEQRREQERRQRREEEMRQEAALMEEVTRREAEERARREEAILRELEERFSRLRSKLLGIENWQRTALLNEQSRETDQCRSAAVRKRDGVKEKLERERLELETEAAAKIAHREAEWKKEYAVRVAWERQLEEDYALLLRVSKLRGPGQAEAAMRSYMIKNDARRDAWRKTRDEERERFRVTVREDLMTSETLIYALVRSAHRAVDCELLEIKRKHKAEFRWFELATAERHRLLAEMEAVERENGGEMPDVAGSLLRLADEESDDGTAASFRSWEIQDPNYY
ncbi:hypothetical protein V8F33_000245 [Rhypophila sp. PSN 637]